VVEEYKDWHTDRINHYGLIFTEVTCIVTRTMTVLDRVIAVPYWQRFALYLCRIIAEPSLSISSWMYWCCHWCIDLLMYRLVLNIDTIENLRTVIENLHIRYLKNNIRLFWTIVICCQMETFTFYYEWCIGHITEYLIEK